MVHVVSLVDKLVNFTRAGFVASANDVLREAQRRSRSSHISASGKVEQPAPNHMRVIFTAPDARARERGAFIRPRRGRTGRNGRAAVLRFADGTFRPQARLKKRPYLTPAGRMWGDFLVARLRGGPLSIRGRRR